jgi:hypothetical protein
MGLLLENEADCLSHQHKHRRHCPVIRCQRRERSPIPRERFSPIGHYSHSTTGVGKAATSHFPDTHWAAVANDRLHRTRMRTFDPKLPVAHTRWRVR